MAPDYSGFSGVSPVAIRMEQKTMSDGSLRLNIQVMSSPNSTEAMIAIREGFKLVLNKISFGQEPIYEEELDHTADPTDRNESIEEFYRRTVVGPYDSKRYN